MRRSTRKIQVGSVAVGGDAPISVQSMCSTDTRDVAATSAQIEALALCDPRLRLRVDLHDAHAMRTHQRADATARAIVQ